MEPIVAAFSSEETRHRAIKLLESGGYTPAACCASGGEAIRATRSLGGAVVVCGSKFRDMTASQLAADLQGQAVLLVMATAAHLDFCEGENLVKLPLPASRAEFFATLETLCRRGPWRPCHPAPQRNEEEQRLIRQAKELLMNVNRMSEAEAHRFLQKHSMDTGMKLADTARLILERYTG